MHTRSSGPDRFAATVGTGFSLVLLLMDLPAEGVRLAPQANKPAQTRQAVVTDLKGAQTVVTELAAMYEAEPFVSQGVVRTPRREYGLQTVDIELRPSEGRLTGKERVSLSLADLRLAAFEGWETNLACRPLGARFEKRDGGVVTVSKDASGAGAVRYEEKDANGVAIRTYTVDTYGYTFVSGVDLLKGFEGRGRLSTGAEAEFSIPCQQVRTIEFR